jgi:hypothetical protein
VKRLAAVLAAIWHYEPVLLSALPTVLVTVGLTAAEADSIAKGAAGAVAIVAEIQLAFAARRKVRPTAKGKQA